MTDNIDPPKSWLKRISHALLREPRDRKQLIQLLHDAKNRELLNSEAFKMIEGVLTVSELRVRDIMIPRAQMVVIPEDASPEEVIPQIIESRHSRFPVIVENRDKVIGILLAKDLLPYQLKTNTKIVTIKDIARPATFIPESKRLDVLLNDFRLNRMHMAIVVDEYGGVAGLITIEDVLEQIVGDIEDEYDINKNKTFIKQVDAQNFAVQALTPLEEFNDFFNTEIDDEDYDTVGGFLLQQFSHMPKPGESIKHANLQFNIIQANNRGINLIRVTQLPDEKEET